MTNLDAPGTSLCKSFYWGFITQVWLIKSLAISDSSISILSPFWNQGVGLNFLFNNLIGFSGYRPSS